jgi:hypothetical protein
MPLPPRNHPAGTSIATTACSIRNLRKAAIRFVSARSWACASARNDCAAAERPASVRAARPATASTRRSNSRRAPPIQSTDVSATTERLTADCRATSADAASSCPAARRAPQTSKSSSRSIQPGGGALPAKPTSLTCTLSSHVHSHSHIHIRQYPIPNTQYPRSDGGPTPCDSPSQRNSFCLSCC